ncbi:MAG: hypothetical protein QNJ30_12215 [Kiloniellales bacterium]|nr:hypothetical protein [Kiloniellales bacterium]
MRPGFPGGRRRGARCRGEAPRGPGPETGPVGRGPCRPEVAPPAEAPAPDDAPVRVRAPATAPAQVRRAELHRLSEGANGLNLWGYITPDPLCRVLAPGYFAPVAAWLAPFDRILVTAGAGGRRPCHVTLVVADRGPEGPRLQRLPA